MSVAWKFGGCGKVLLPDALVKGHQRGTLPHLLGQVGGEARVEDGFQCGKHDGVSLCGGVACKRKATGRVLE